MPGEWFTAPEPCQAALPASIHFPAESLASGTAPPPPPPMPGSCPSLSPKAPSSLVLRGPSGPFPHPDCNPQPFAPRGGHSSLLRLRCLRLLTLIHSWFSQSPAAGWNPVSEEHVPPKRGPVESGFSPGGKLVDFRQRRLYS